MPGEGFVTRSEYQKHIRGEWRTIHNLWPHIRKYVPGFGYSKAEIDAMFVGTEGSIAFADATGFIAEDNTNFAWNNTLKVLEVLAPTNNTYIGKGVIGGGNSVGSNNVLLGYEAGYSFVAAHSNTFVGYFAGRLNTESDEGALFGYYSGYYITTSPQNACFGAHAGKQISTGQGKNTCIGHNAGGALNTGYFNVMLGAETGGSITTGYKNTCLGYNAEVFSTGSHHRIAIGCNAMSKEDNLCVIGGTAAADAVSLAIFYNKEFRFYDDGNNYVGFKAPALSSNKIWELPDADGPANEALATDGAGALIWRTHNELAGYVAKEHRAWEDSIGEDIHDDNIPSSAITQHEGDIDHDALTNYAADQHLVALDEDDLVSDSDTNVATQQSIKAYVDALPAGVSTFVGLTDTPANYTNAARRAVFVNAAENALEFLAGFAYNTTDHWVKLGYQAGNALLAGGQYHVFAGEAAGFGTTSGDKSVYVGYRAGFTVSTGGKNVAIGYQALYTGNVDFCVAIGTEALWKNTASGNVAIGANALRLNTSGSNIAIGYCAGLQLTTGGANVLIGYEAGLAFTLANRNVAIGKYAARNNTGSYNVALGMETLYVAGAGSYNMAIGYSCLRAITSGYYNVGIGNQTLRAITTVNGNVAIGHQAGYNLVTGAANVLIGYQAGYNELGSNKLYIANTNTATPLIYGEFDNGFITINGYLNITTMKSGATQVAAGAAAGELWYTDGHATLLDNIVMMGV